MRALFAAIPAVVAGAILVAAPRQVDGQVRRPHHPPPPAYGGYELQVVVNGSPRAEYQAAGHTWVEGRLGERYSLRVTNHDARRVEVVLAVDGRDALDGQPSHNGKRGYVLPAYGSAEIDGFRLSRADVAAFRFTTVTDSYASRTGTPWTVGQITASFFPERYVPRPPPPPLARRSPSPSGESRAAPRESAPRQGLGTEFGERRYSPVHETSFVRADSIQPAGRVAIRYNDRRGLCSIGLDFLCERPRPRPYVQPYPYEPYDPYPQPYEPPPRYSTPPPGWTE